MDTGWIGSVMGNGTEHKELSERLIVHLREFLRARINDSGGLD